MATLLRSSWAARHPHHRPRGPPGGVQLPAHQPGTEPRQPLPAPRRARERRDLVHGCAGTTGSRPRARICGPPRRRGCKPTGDSGRSGTHVARPRVELASSVSPARSPVDDGLWTMMVSAPGSWPGRMRLVLARGARLAAGDLAGCYSRLGRSSSRWSRWSRWWTSGMRRSRLGRGLRLSSARWVIAFWA
jgi:hypothetical protein